MKNILLFLITLITALAFLSCGDSGKDDSSNLEKESTSEFQKRYGIKSGDKVPKFEILCKPL